MAGMKILTGLGAILIFANFHVETQGLADTLVCTSGGCYNGGTCNENSGVCICNEPFVGRLCEDFNGSCALYDVCNNGTCNDITGRCNCTKPFSGPTCVIARVSPCSPSPCQNNATCVEGIPRPTCQCAGNFTGSFCEIPPPCTPSPCAENGTCQVNPNYAFGYRCVCNRGYGGAFCADVTNPCRFFRCDRGECVLDENREPFCSCYSARYYGDKCEKDYCDGFECGNGQCVVDYHGAPSCTCDPYSTGDKCEQDIDECKTGPYPCFNGGTCLNATGAGNVVCNCPPNTSGTYCEISVGGLANACNPDPCKNNGRCIIGDRPWLHTCRCQAGWWGTETCDTATCDREGSAQGYAYEEYELDFPKPGQEGPPVEYYCLNGGTCMPSGTEELPECLCPEGNRGDRCEIAYVIVGRLLPTFGPQSGGTTLTVTGRNFNSKRRPAITIGNFTCPLVTRNNTAIVCTTEALTSVGFLGRPLPVTVLWQSDSTEIISDSNFTYMKDPEITKLEPLESILSGGVAITVTGQNLNSVSAPIMTISVVYRLAVIAEFESSPCEVSSPTVMYCETPDLEIFDKDGKVNVTKTKEREAGPTLNIGPPRNQPTRRKRHAPSLNKALFSSKEADLHAGNEVYIDDTLDSLSSPRRKRFVPAYPYVSVSKGQSAEDLEGKRKQRFVPAYPYESLGRFRRQSGAGGSGDQSEKVASLLINNEVVDFYIGFRLDGVDTYQNLSEALPEYSRLTVYIDPQVEPWDVRLRDFRTFSPFNHKSIEITGKHLSTGLQSSNYFITIGRGQCTDVDLTSNRIFCNAPDSKPEKDEDNGYGVLVRIGKRGKLTFSVGEMNYQTSPLEYPPTRAGIIIGCVLLVIIILIVIIVIVVRSRR